MKTNIVIITLSLVIAGIGAFVLLNGHWATPIAERLIMH